MKKIAVLFFIILSIFNAHANTTFNGIDGYSFGDKFNNKLYSEPKDLGVLGKLYEVENNDINYDRFFLYVNTDSNTINGMLKVKQTPNKKVCDLILKQRVNVFVKESGFKSTFFNGGYRLSVADSPERNIAMFCDSSNVLSAVFMDLKNFNED